MVMLVGTNGLSMEMKKQKVQYTLQRGCVYRIREGTKGVTETRLGICLGDKGCILKFWLIYSFLSFFFFYYFFFSELGYNALL